MKILFVSNGFPPDAFGGVEQHTYHLASQLKKNHEIFIFCRKAGPRQRQFSVETGIFEGMYVYKVINNYPLFSEYYENEEIENQFERFASEVRPDILHIQHTIPLSPRIIERGERLRIPIITTLHDYFYFCHKVHLLKTDNTVCLGPNDGATCVECLAPHLFAERLPLARKLKPVIFALYRGVPTNLRTRIKSLYLHRKRIAIQHEKKPIPVTMQEDVFDHRYRIRRNIELLNMSDLITTPSAFVKEMYVKQGVRPDLIRVNPLGIYVPPEVIHHRARTHLKSKGPMNFGYLGSFFLHKGVHIAIEAFKRLSGEAKLFLYGGGNDPLYNRRTKKMSKAPGISLMGPYSHADVYSILNKLDVILIPSLSLETYNFVLREAFFMKRPVIASRIGALAEFIEGNRNGFFFEPGNVTELVEKMQMFIDNPELIVEFQQHMPRVKTIEENAEEIEDFYKEVITCSKRV